MKPTIIMKKSVLFLVLIALGVASQSVFAAPNGGLPTPDGGSTALLLTATVGGLSWVAKRIRK
jgi:hypothetical protein